jgi:hypothetical protein
MNTRFDYEYIRDNNILGWEKEWKNLLDGRWISRDLDLIEDLNAKIFRLGFTVSEVAATVGMSDYNEKPKCWYENQPDRFQSVGSSFVEVDGWGEKYEEEKYTKEIEEKLKIIDSEVEHLSQEAFEYDGHLYYPDVETIQGVFIMLPLLPSDFSMEWKTADKVKFKNVYVTLDKRGITELAVALFQYKTKLWKIGDEVKKELKECNTSSEVAAMDISLRVL